MLVIAGLKGVSQCQVTNFIYTIGPSGSVNFENYNFYYDSLAVPDTYIWNFGDGDTSQSGNFSINHTYSTAGTYTVSLEVINTTFGCDTTLSQTFYINLCAGGAYYNISQIGFGDYSFAATNLSSLPGATVLWNFGDAATSTSINASHQYSTSGNYQVSLIVTDASLLCADTFVTNNPVTICNLPIYVVDTTVALNPAVVDFGTVPSNASYTYSWSYGDGGTGTGINPNHAYHVNGFYSAYTTVTDVSTGCSATAYDNLNINLCGINYASIGNSGNGYTQSFTSFAQDSGVTITGYQWSFPGASPSSASVGQPTGITYPSAGTYSACLFITTNIGCIDTICQTVNITPPVYNITGRVAKGQGSTLGAVVYLIRQDSIGHLALADSIIILSDSGSISYFSFNNVAIDTYYVKAALSATDPDYASFMPTYYQGVLTWGTATPVVISAINPSSSAYVDFIAGVNTGGPGFVGGYISQGAGLVIGGSGNNNAKQLGDPLSGVQVNLLTSNNAAVAYTYTDALGHYQFPNLALGSYKIYAEELNKVPGPLDFTLTANNPTDSSANISINSHSATGIDNVSGLQISQVYPNPVVSTAQLQIVCAQNVDGNLKLVDVLGRTTLQQNIKLVTGQNTYELNLEQLCAGVYQLVVQAGGNQITYKLVKAK